MIYPKIVLSSATALALLAGMGFLIHPAAATTITFDDLTDTSGGIPEVARIPNGYQGLNWTNWNVLNTADFTTNVGANGAQAGTVEPRPMSPTTCLVTWQYSATTRLPSTPLI